MMDQANVTANQNGINGKEETGKKAPTLCQLMKMLGKVQKEDRTPTVKKLEEGGDPFIELGSCRVFSNGYAAYDNGSGRTVFWLPDCRFFEFRFTRLDNSEKDEQMTDHKKMGKKYMRAQPWYMAVMLMGDHRVEENMENRKGSRVGTREETETENGSREDEVEGRIARKMNPSAFGNPETLYIRKEEVSERLGVMTETQRRVFIAYYRDGMTQEQIGEELGVAHQTVSRHLKAAEKKMANFE